MRDSNYDKCSMSYAFDRKTLTTHKIYLLPKNMSSIVLFMIHFLIHSLTLGSRGYFFLIDISRRSRVNESQSAEEKKITSGHRSTQPHFHARSSSEIELDHRLDTPMSAGN